MRRLLLLASVLLALDAAAEEAPKPKLGPEATPIFESTEYLRNGPAPDYWALSPFYVPQQTSSDCSAAAAVMALNMLRGLPSLSEEMLLTEADLLAAVAEAGEIGKKWAEQVAEDGPGVTFDAFAEDLRESARVAGIDRVTLVSGRPGTADDTELTELRNVLAANEASDKDVMLVYFNQGVVTGDWDGPHISPIGAYDKVRDRVLIMDVDRDWYVPYWTSAETLLKAMVKPTPSTEEMGPLAGETGGYFLLRRQ